MTSYLRAIIVVTGCLAGPLFAAVPLDQRPAKPDEWANEPTRRMRLQLS